jgi:hypothetical protein
MNQKILHFGKGVALATGYGAIAFLVSVAVRSLIAQEWIIFSAATITPFAVVFLASGCALTYSATRKRGARNR